MKKFRKVLLAVLFAVILALGAACITACGDKEGGAAKPRYTLTFMVGTVRWDSVTVEAGSSYKLNKDEDPDRGVNYVFEGWSQTANGPVEALPDKMPAGNRTYYAVFSARYNLNFNAGIGVIPDDKKTVIAKEGDDLYGLVKDITPTVENSDATFKGWFLRGTSEITATSGQKMPKGNAEVVAKYSVGYKINVYLETKFDSGNYAAQPDEVVNKSAFVGDKVAGLPTYAGYYYDDGKDNDVLYANLNKNSAQNAFDLYFKIVGYDVIFNANLPADVEYTGSVESMTCGHGEEYTVPANDAETGFKADGYRFSGWSTMPEGEVEYREGETFTVEKSTTMYARWVKGMTEIAGRSSDRVYLIEKKIDGVKRVVPYLERTGLSDLAGEYDPTHHIFTFKKANASEQDGVLLRGIADSAHNTFTYLNTENAATYKLQKLDETVDSAVTLKLNEDGTAVYSDGTDTTNGKYVSGSDGSMLFTVDGKAEFAFRLIHTADGFTTFMIRGAEYGTWNNITQAGNVDLTYTMQLDGYGYATMYVSGFNSSLSGRITTPFNGRYSYTSGEGAYAGTDGKEVRVRLFNSSLQMRQFDCLLLEGTYHTLSTDDTNVYTNVYLQKFEATIYGAPEGGAALNTATADKIVLDGYSVVADSATYTYTDGEGQTVTVKGKYYYDSTAGTLRIIPTAGGAELRFEITLSGEGDDRVPVFEPVDELYGQYAVRGLDSVFGPNLIYTLSIYNNNRAAFSFRIPMYDDTFYGNVVMDYTRMVFGDFTVAVEGKTETGGADPRANVYEFSAEINPQIIAYLYNMYRSLYGQVLNVGTFGSFRFQFVYSATTQRISYVNVTVIGDYQADRKVTYNDVEYTLNGFGTAESESDNIQYIYNTALGIKRLFLVPDSKKPDETVLFIDYDDEFVAYEKSHATNNSDIPFLMMFFKNSTAMLTFTSNSTFEAFAFGTVTWEDEEHTRGKFVRDDGVSFSDDFLTVNKMIKDFKFVIRTSTVKDNKGQDVTSTIVYVYDGNAADDGDEIVIETAEAELTLKPLAVTETTDGQGNNVNVPSAAATYIVKGTDGNGDTEYNGTYSVLGDRVYFTYTTQQSGGAKPTAQTITFKLEYSNGAISGFRRVSGEEGYALSADDGKSYMYLSGEAVDGEASTYGATYYQYDAENQSYTEYHGTYELTRDSSALYDSTFGIGYDFTYETGDVDGDGNKVTEMFTFGIGRDRTNIRYFKKFVLKIETQYVLYMSASVGQPARIGTLGGGGYSAHVLTLYPNTQYQTQYQGVLEWSDDWSIWVLTATNGAQFYFKIISGMGVFIMDNTYVAEAKGMFTLSETVTVKVPATEGQDATEDTEAVPAVPEHDAVATKIEMSGMAFAYLHYDYNGEDKTIMGIYVQYANNGFAFLHVTADSTEVLFRFRLQMNTDEQTGEVSYVAELADMNYFGTYEGDDLTVINLNGYNGAYYVDGYGRVYSGQFTIEESDEHSALIHITYIDTTDYVVKHAYARLDFENRTFVTVSAPAQNA